MFPASSMGTYPSFLASQESLCLSLKDSLGNEVTTRGHMVLAIGGYKMVEYVTLLLLALFISMGSTPPVLVVVSLPRPYDWQP